jgi:hypothetical protein
MRDAYVQGRIDGEAPAISAGISQESLLMPEVSHNSKLEKVAQSTEQLPRWGDV